MPSPANRYQVVKTLNGMLKPKESLIADMNANDNQPEVQYWAGSQIKQGNGFRKQRDNVTDWEAVYYKSGLFQYIQ